MNCHYVIIAGLAADRLCQSASIRNEVNRTAAAYFVTTPSKLYLPLDLHEIALPPTSLRGAL